VLTDLYTETIGRRLPQVFAEYFRKMWHKTEYFRKMWHKTEYFRCMWHKTIEIEEDAA